MVSFEVIFFSTGPCLESPNTTLRFRLRATIQASQLYLLLVPIKGLSINSAKNRVPQHVQFNSYMPFQHLPPLLGLLNALAVSIADMLAFLVHYLAHCFRCITLSTVSSSEPLLVTSHSVHTRTGMRAVDSVVRLVLSQ